MDGIESAQYLENGSILVVANGVEMFIPADPANTDYLRMKQWEAEGGTIDPFVPPTEEEIRASLPALTNRQVRMALRASGISLASVDTAIASIEDEEQRDYAQIEWEYATQFERSHPLIGQIGAMLSLTEEQIDQMWVAAQNI